MFEKRINEFFTEHPEGKILGVHPKNSAGKGLVALVSYDMDVKPYQAITAELRLANDKNEKLQSILTVTQDRAADYQSAALEKDKELKEVEAEKEKAVKAAEAEKAKVIKNANDTISSLKKQLEELGIDLDET